MGNCVIFSLTATWILTAEYTAGHPQEVIGIPADPDKVANGICTPVNSEPSSNQTCTFCTSEHDCDATTASTEYPKCDLIRQICVASNQPMTVLISKTIIIVNT